MLDSVGGDTKALWDQETQGGSLQEISTTDEEIRGGEASVQIHLGYERGGSSGVVTPMIQEDGVWKLAPSQTP